MKKILILILICTCLNTLGFAVIAWKLYPCPCSYLSSRNRSLYYGTSGTKGVSKGSVTGAAKGTVAGAAKSSAVGSVKESAIGVAKIPDEYTVIILSKTERVIDIRRCTE